MRRRHDPFLKRLYQAGTRDALTLFLPGLAAHIDWSHWHWIEKEVVIRGGRPRSVVADLVGETRDVEGRYLFRSTTMGSPCTMPPTGAWAWETWMRSPTRSGTIRWDGLSHRGCGSDGSTGWNCACG
jgi:hypothetical protein